MQQSWSQIISEPYVADGAALASSTSLTDVSPTPNTIIPANLLVPGSRLRVTAHGRFSNTATPTLLLGVYWGGVAGTKLAATGATTTTVSATNWPWRLEATIACRSIGSSGTLLTTGFVDLGTALTAVLRIPIDASASTAVTVATDSAKALTIGAQWGTNSGSNTLTVHDFLIESLL